MANIEKKDVEKKDVKKKKDKPAIFTRIGKYFHEVWGEVKKLAWPSRKELISYTLTVLAFIVVFAIILYACDLIFAEGLNLLSKI